MSGHTEGPWRVASGCQIRSAVHQIARVWMFAGGQGKANALRIVACVNACEGVTTEALEQMRFSLPVAYDQMRTQRDALLEALESLANSAPAAGCSDFNHKSGDFHDHDELCPPLDRYEAACLAARAAIAKAKGEQPK